MTHIQSDGADKQERDARQWDFLQRYIRDLRTVLETLHDSEPWIPRAEFIEAFTENDLAELYDDMFGDRPGGDA